MKIDLDDFNNFKLKFLSLVWYIGSLLLRCIHHFKSDFINNVYHTSISGYEPSSVILGQPKQFKKLKKIPL